MNGQSNSPTVLSIGGSLNWVIGGTVGGALGSLLFGVLLWAIDPDIVAVAIPAIYGFNPAGAIGWALHLVHGSVLGIVFGFLVSREPILGALTADVETDFIAAMGPGIRLTLAGAVYGLAVWAILPVIVLPIWMAVAGVTDPRFPAIAFESLVGHLLFGLLLGALFSVFVETASEAKETEAPFEETSETPQK